MKKLIQFLYKRALRPLLFTQNPDRVHDRAIRLGAWWGKHAFLNTFARKTVSHNDPALEQEICGISFCNPVGLAAGFDKNGDTVRVLPHIGLGFASIGSVTWKPYGGNPRPWSYRLPDIQSLIVNYGLKNIGAEKVLEKLALKAQGNFVTGISVAKTNSEETVNREEAIRDYIETIKIISKRDAGDYIEINISCPNAFGGEPFTDPESLGALLGEVQKLAVEKPIFIKMPINMEWEGFRPLLDLAIQYGISGVVIGNLNKDRGAFGEVTNIPEHIKGSLSGKPTEELSNKLISKTYEQYGNKLVIVGVGGIFSAEDAYEKIKRGASLVQLITGMIYEGPQLIGQINEGLVKLLHADGYTKIEEAVGVYHK